MIVSGSGDKTVRVWDLASGKAIGAPLRGHVHEGPVRAVAMSLLRGRPVIVSGSDFGTVRVWDLASGKAIGKVIGAALRGHRYSRSAVTSVATASLQGRPVIVSGSEDDTIRLWDLASVKAIGAPLRGHDGRVVRSGERPAWRAAP